MVKIYGASDDLVEIEDHSDGNEVDCYNENVLITVGWTGEDSPQLGRGLYVLMRHSPPPFNNGCWTAEISPIEEGADIPWDVSVVLHEKGYSVVVIIDCPDEVPISWKKISL